MYNINKTGFKYPVFLWNFFIKLNSIRIIHNKK